MKDYSKYTLKEVKQLNNCWLDANDLWELKNCNKNVINCETLSYNKEYCYKTEKVNLIDGTYITVTLG